MKERAKLYKTQSNRQSHVLSKRLSNEDGPMQMEQDKQGEGNKRLKGADGKPVQTNQMMGGGQMQGASK